jgi:hypothetical protein
MTSVTALAVAVRPHYKWWVVAMLWLIIAQRESLGLAIALASTVYVAAGVLLLTGILFFVKQDSARMAAELSAS